MATAKAVVMGELRRVCDSEGKRFGKGNKSILCIMTNMC